MGHLFSHHFRVDTQVFLPPSPLWALLGRGQRNNTSPPMERLKQFSRGNFLDILQQARLVAWAKTVLRGFSQLLATKYVARILTTHMGSSSRRRTKHRLRSFPPSKRQASFYFAQQKHSIFRGSKRSCTKGSLERSSSSAGEQTPSVQDIYRGEQPPFHPPEEELSL